MARDVYTLFCGNFSCPTRRAGQLHEVKVEDIPDGDLWFCDACAPCMGLLAFPPNNPGGV